MRLCLALIASSGLALTCVAATNPLIDAARGNSTEAVTRLLKAGGANVNAPAADGATALHYAVQKDNVPMATALVGAGADVKLPNRYGVAPIGIADEKD